MCYELGLCVASLAWLLPWCRRVDCGWGLDFNIVLSVNTKRMKGLLSSVVEDSLYEYRLPSPKYSPCLLTRKLEKPNAHCPRTVLPLTHPPTQSS
ncbi:hypothetical protein BDR22DRAFT_259970 [Usnea florida]